MSFTIFAVTRGKPPRRELNGLFERETDAESRRDELNVTYQRGHRYQVTSFLVHGESGDE